MDLPPSFALREFWSYKAQLYVENLFRKSGFTTVTTEGRAFDFYAYRGDERYAVQVRTSERPSGARIHSTQPRHYAHLKRAMEEVTRHNLQGILWHHCVKRDTHETYLYTSEGFTPLPNPIADHLPTPLPIPPARRGRPRKEATLIKEGISDTVIYKP